MCKTLISSCSLSPQISPPLCTHLLFHLRMFVEYFGKSRSKSSGSTMSGNAAPSRRGVRQSPSDLDAAPHVCTQQK